MLRVSDRRPTMNIDRATSALANMKRNATAKRASGSLDPVVIQPGSQIVITGEHPWRGETGQYLRDETTPFGIKALVSLDNGTDCYAKHEHLKAV